jgi:hypothetical protein
MPRLPAESAEVEEIASDDKAQLQQQVDDARESISQAVEQIRGTVEQQVDSVRETVGGVLSLRSGVQSDPVVWSLGALSAGFALGYTLGYANKSAKSRGRLPTPVSAFVDDLARELSKVGKELVLPSLDAHIQSALGFELSDVLEQMGDHQRRPHSRRSEKQRARRKTRPSRKRAKRPRLRSR